MGVWRATKEGLVKRFGSVNERCRYAKEDRQPACTAEGTNAETVVNSQHFPVMKLSHSVEVGADLLALAVFDSLIVAKSPSACLLLPQL